MTQLPQEEPFSEAHLNSPQYRERLMRKLNCLIAVLEVATAKARKSLSPPSPDAERLARICANLQSTLEVCLRARSALERRQSTPEPEPGKPARIPRAPVRDEPRRRAARNPRASIELTSAAERKKFLRLGPIDRGMVGACDLDELARRLMD